MVVNESLLLTDCSYNWHSSSSTIRFSDLHISSYPHSLTYKLLVKLTLINVDHLLASFHELCNLHRCLLLVNLYLILVAKLAIIGILGLNIPHFSRLIDFWECLYWHLHSKLWLYKHHSLSEREMCPLLERFDIGEIFVELWWLTSRPMLATLATIDDLEAVLLPLSHHSCCRIPVHSS